MAEHKHAEHVHQEKKTDAVRRFLLDQHEWIKKRLDEISQAPTTLEAPEFPMWVFEGEEEENKEEESEVNATKKKKSLKRKKPTKTRGKGKKKVGEEEWVDLESTEEEEVEGLKDMEKETDEEDPATATEGSEKNEDLDDFDLGLSLEEILRKKKGKDPVLEQIIPPPSPPSTPPSTGTTPPTTTKDNADVIQKEKEKEKSDIHKEKTPPILEETPDISTNFVFENTDMQDLNESPKEANTGAATATTEVTATGASAPGEHAPGKQPIVEKIVEGNLEETLNVVVTQLVDKRMQDLLKKKPANISAKPMEEQSGANKEDVTEEEPKKKTTAEEEEATLKVIADTLTEMPGAVLQKPATLETSAHAQGEPAPKADTEPKTDASASKSGTKEKKMRIKHTATRSSNRLRSGAKP